MMNKYKVRHFTDGRIQLAEVSAEEFLIKEFGDDAVFMVQGRTVATYAGVESINFA